MVNFINDILYSGYNLRGTTFANHPISYPAVIFATIKFAKAEVLHCVILHKNHVFCTCNRLEVSSEAEAFL